MNGHPAVSTVKSYTWNAHILDQARHHVHTLAEERIEVAMRVALPDVNAQERGHLVHVVQRQI